MVEEDFARSFGMDGVSVVKERRVKKAWDVDDKPRTYDDAEHRRIGEQEIRRRGMPALGRVEFVHKII